MLLFQVLLEISITELIAFLILPILGQILLNRIISQMYSCCVCFQTELKTSCSDVPLLIPIATYYSIYACDHHVMPNVEFSAAIKKWAVKIGLHDVGFWIAVSVFLFGFY
jgi:hypothetical protein